MPTYPKSDTVRHRVELLAKLLDSQFRLPGTNFRFGWDGLIGLLPGADLLTTLPSLYILFEARRAKMPLRVLLAMLGNILLDGIIGLIPLVGDLFDFAFKANLRNARLFEREFDSNGTNSRGLNE